MTELPESDARSQACVYVYRRLDGTIVYFGRGLTPDRAQSHTGGSHNAALSELIATGEYELEIAGPYDAYEVAMEVEAAMISALARPGKHDLFNRVPGNGHRFAPLGVPTELAERPLLPPLTVSEVGGRRCKRRRTTFGPYPPTWRPTRRAQRGVCPDFG